MVSDIFAEAKDVMEDYCRKLNDLKLFKYKKGYGKFLRK